LLQITRTTPLRRTTLQLRHNFFTEAITFIFPLLYPLAAACGGRNYFARNTMRARVRSYGVICTVTLSPGRMRM
jgi:hypothetical protein